MYIIIKKSPQLVRIILNCRDDKIRTCDPTPPRRVRYRAALHPEIFYVSIYNQGMAKVIEIFNLNIPIINRLLEKYLYLVPPAPALNNATPASNFQIEKAQHIVP